LPTHTNSNGSAAAAAPAAAEAAEITYGRIWVTTRDSNPGIPNPGIGDALIPGFRDYEKCKNALILQYICPKNTFSPEFWGQFPALKLRVSGLNPNTNYVIMVDIVLQAQSC